MPSRPRKYIPGHMFGLLRLISVLDDARRYARLQCSCGKTIIAPMSNLTTGRKTDCGHIHTETRRLAALTKRPRNENELDHAARKYLESINSPLLHTTKNEMITIIERMLERVK